MIKSNELRIGNWLLATGSLTRGYFHQVTAIEPDMIFFGPIALSLGNCGGIPLTEEWLERMGFEPDQRGWRLKISETMFVWWGEFERTFRICFTDVDYSYPLYLKPPTYHFQYVHQLQNLYFALCGEELTIKL